MALIEFEIRPDDIGMLRMNRPDVRNALSWEAMHLFADTVERAHQSPALRALIVTGNEGTFCAGGDLFELHDYPTRMDGARLAALMGDALERLETLPCPTIAAVEGPALGGGAEIALACDIRIMAEDAMLGLMHVRLGIPPAWGGGQRLLRLVGYARATEWITSGKVMSGPEAAENGLTNRLTASGETLDEAIVLAQEIAQNDPPTVQAIKRMLRAGLSLPATKAKDAERAEFPDLWAAPAHLERSERFVSKKTRQPG